jgi:hypothetical protein
VSGWDPEKLARAFAHEISHCCAAPDETTSDECMCEAMGWGWTC